MTDLMDTYIENREMVQPNHANNLGTAHGGNVMLWMDEIAAMAAMRFAGETCVTARVDQMNFERPIHVGDTALLNAYAYEAGKSSVKIRVRAHREDIRTGENEKTTESYFVFVAIDEDKQPTTVPELTVNSERGEQLLEEALDGENGC